MSDQPSTGSKDTVEELREQFEAEDAAGQPKGEEISPAAQTPAVLPGDNEGVRDDLDDDDGALDEPTEPMADYGLSDDEIGVRLDPEEMGDDVDSEESDTTYIAIDTRSGEMREISGFAYGALKTIHSVMPPRLAFYLGVGALVVIEVVEPPVIAAVALGYEALRRWTR